MDKVIIDNVDVSECPSMRLIENEIICQGGNTKIFKDYSYVCCENSNCYYKQLKRKEQECEELEKQKEILLNQLIVYDGEDVTIQISQGQFEEYNKLKAENEKLKEVTNTSIIEQEKLVAQVNKYSQCLQEIREIVEGCQYGDCHECKYKPIDDCRTQLIVNVIAKINEVIGVE